VHTHQQPYLAPPSRTHQPRRHHHQRKIWGLRLNHDERAGSALRVDSSLTCLPPSLVALHTLLYYSTLYTVSHAPLRCDCSLSVNPITPPDLLSDAPDTLVGLARLLLTSILPAPDPCPIRMLGRSPRAKIQRHTSATYQFPLRYFLGLPERPHFTHHIHSHADTPWVQPEVILRNVITTASTAWLSTTFQCCTLQDDTEAGGFAS
jgi:hypothetical protein